MTTNALYDAAWYEGLSSMRAHNERAVWAMLACFGRRASLVDFGCGDGWTVKTAQQSGVIYAVGVEVDAAAQEVAHGVNIIVKDLTLPCDLGQSFDYVLSWEVGEHLPEAAADIYVETLARHTREFLIFTAAKVGQGGYNHINCQDQPYWREKLESHGLLYAERATERLREVWKICTGPLIWLPQNLQVFIRP